MDVADSAVVDGAISGLELLTKAVAGVGDVFGEAGEAVVAFGGFLASAFLAGNIPKVLNAIVEFGKSTITPPVKPFSKAAFVIIFICSGFAG